MTTIAYKDGILACDSQVTWDGHIRGREDDKIKKLNSVTVLASAGNLGDCIRMEEFFSDPNWENKLDKKPKVSKYEGVLSYKGKVFYLTGNDNPTPLHNEFYSIGSGWELAFSAMALGLSAPDAVAFACKFDVYSSEPVVSFNVKELQEERKIGRRKN